MPSSTSIEALPQELRRLVGWAVALLGRVIERELGHAAYERIEGLRRQMAGLRQNHDSERAHRVLIQTYRKLAKLGRAERIDIARSYTLMLELINACENAYRSHRLATRAKPTHQRAGLMPDYVIYVLTAHPTEAREPRNVAAFHVIQKILEELFDPSAEGGLNLSAASEQRLRHALEIAWRSPLVRERAPEVKDEAEYLYSLLIRDEMLLTLLNVSAEGVPVYLRTWVGGDKDGHPGVDEKTLLESLNLSRVQLLSFLRERLSEVRRTLASCGERDLMRELARVSRLESSLREVRAGDGKRVNQLKSALQDFRSRYESKIGAAHPALLTIRGLLHGFPALVVPLELRESSDVLMKAVKAGDSAARDFAIVRMLRAVARLSEGGDPRWYARGFIISMAESVEHMRAALQLVRRAFGQAALPVIPLFEERESLKNSDSIVREILADRSLLRSIRTRWGGFLEVMVGYSDSAKESGALASRLLIAEALPKIERICQRRGVTPLFFHGSGGSIDRGGGSIEDQTAWWPRSALRYYKVTVQGEMVERSLASSEIARGQIRHIIESASRSLASRRSAKVRNRTLDRFASSVADSYQAAVHSDHFLEMVEKATPYPFLSVLKIGSRPTKRASRLSVSSLRAIPWVLCWTQTRVLFQTWWGVGRAWRSCTPSERAALRRAFNQEPVFRSYVKALGFTLAKVELAVWRIYLETSSLDSVESKRVLAEFQNEFSGALEFFRGVTGQKDLLWSRKWLGASIRLRSPMIHPLNLLQIIAEKEKDFALIRYTVTGISSGMLTTG